MVKVLFICKHNRFRSRVAEVYFNNSNRKSRKNENRAKSAGIYPNNDPLDKSEVALARKFGIDIRGKPKKISPALLKWQDVIVIVADDVRKRQIKNHKKYKVIMWKVKDTDIVDEKKIKRIIKEIIKRIDSFNRKIKRDEIKDTC